MATPATRSGSTGLPRGVEAGPFGARFMAYVVDHLFPVVVLGTASYLEVTLSGASRTTTPVVAAALVLAYGIVVWWMYAVRMSGPGMKVTRLQLVGLTDGKPIGWARFFLRWLVLTLLTATGVGLIIMLIVMSGQRRRQGWHDLAANSVVIRERVVGVSHTSHAARTARPVAAAVPVTAPPASVDSPVPATAAAESPASAPAALATEAPPLVEAPDRRPVDAAATDGGAAEPADGLLDAPTAVQAARPVSVAESATWHAVLDDGREIAVDGLILLGRNPSGQRGEEGAHLIKIGDESRTVSKTHLAVGVDERGLWVMDRGSTNGSTVTSADGASRPCTAGDVVAVDPESIVSFGDHWFRARRSVPTA